MNSQSRHIAIFSTVRATWYEDQQEPTHLSPLGFSISPMVSYGTSIAPKKTPEISQTGPEVGLEQLRKRLGALGGFSGIGLRPKGASGRMSEPNGRGTETPG
jgi:hypothetical protein